MISSGDVRKPTSPTAQAGDATHSRINKRPPPFPTSPSVSKGSLSSSPRTEADHADDYYFILQTHEALQRHEHSYLGPAWFNLPQPSSPTSLPQLRKERIPEPSFLRQMPTGDDARHVPPWFHLDDLQLCVRRMFQVIAEEKYEARKAQSIVNRVFQDSKKVNSAGKGEGLRMVQKMKFAVQKRNLAEYKAREFIRRLNEGPSVNQICDESYHLPSTVELAAARKVCESVQNTALQRNWHPIRMAFDLNGCLLLPSQLEKVLLAVGLSAKHASRAICGLLHVYGRDLALISYDLFEKVFGGPACRSYEGDETCLQGIRELADPRENMSMAYPDYEQFKLRVDQAFEQCWLYHARFDAATKAYLDIAPSTSTFNPDAFTTVPLSKSEYIRMVYALRRRLSCCIMLRNLAPYRSGMKIYKALEQLGTSLHFLGCIQKLWLSESIPIKTIQEVLEGTYPKHFVELCDSFSSLLPRYVRHAPARKNLIQAVSELRYAAACMIQCVARGVMARRFVRKKRLDEISDRLYYKAISNTCKLWFVYANRRKAFFHATRRKFYVWRIHTRRLLKKRDFFRTIFWPFYVWRRETLATINARAKAKFLKSVWGTLRKLRVMRKWAELSQSSKATKVKALKLYMMRSTSTVRVIFHEWHKLTKYERFQRNCWQSKGLPIHQRHNSKLMEIVFICWKQLVLGTKRFHPNFTPLTNKTCAKDWSPVQIESHEQAVLEDLKSTKSHCVSAVRNVFTALKDTSRIHFYSQAITFKVYLPRLFKEWTSYVEMRQKKRYAWHHFCMRLQRRVFIAWAASQDESATAESSAEGSENKVAVEEEPPKVQRDNQGTSQRQCDKITVQEFQRNKKTQHEQLHRAILAAEALRLEAFKAEEIARHVEESMENFSETLLSCDRLATEFLSRKREEHEQVARQIQQSAASLKDSRGKVLHDVLCKVLDELSEKRVKKYVVLAFRRMRVTVAERHIRSFRNKNLLRKWMKICRRLKQISDGMPSYYEKKLKWRMFNKWLRYINEKYTYRSPGLLDELKRREELLLAFSDGLMQASKSELGEEHFHLSLKGILQRWIEFTQKKVTRNRLVKLSRLRLNLAVKRRVFTVLRRGIRPRYIPSQPEGCFQYKRCAHDLTSWKEQLLACEKQLFSSKSANRNQFVWMQRKLLTLSSTILKKELQRRNEEMEERLSAESRLLYAAFEERGTFRFTDQVLPASGPATSNNLGSFQDEAVQSFVSIKSIRLFLSEGFICGVRLTYLSNNGFLWNTPCRGGDSKTQFDFELESSEGERLVGIEGTISHTIECIRFHTNKGRSSEWIGKAVYGARFLIGSTAPGKSREFIIGLHGRIGVNAIGSIGGVLRTITDYGVFSNCWQHRPFIEERADRQGNVEEAELEQVETQQQKQFARVLAMRRSDVMHAAQRSFKLALCLRYDPTTPAALRSVNAAVALSHWYFEATNKRLLKLDQKTSKASGSRHRRRMTHGYISVRNGNMKIQVAQKELREVEQLSHKGNVLYKVRLTEAEIGMTRTQELLKRKGKAEKLLYEGTREASLGATAMEAGRNKLAKLQCDAALQRHFEKLVELSIVEDSL